MPTASDIPSAAGAAPRRRPWWRSRRIGYLAAASLVLYAVTGFLIVPAVIRSQVLKRVPELTGRRVAIGKVAVNPFALSLRVEDLSLTATNGEPFVAVREFRANLQASSLFRRAFVLREVTVREPLAHLVREPGGEMNYEDIEIELPPIPRVVIESLNIQTGRVEFVDRVLEHPFETRLEPINLTLTNFTTFPDRDHPYVLTAASPSGERFEWRGDVTVHPLRSSGRISLSRIPLNKYEPYVRGVLNVQVPSGEASVEASYRVFTTNKVLEAELRGASVKVANLAVNSAVDQQPVLQLPAVTVEGVEGSFRKRAGRVARVAVNGGNLRAQRDRDGVISLARLLKTAAAPSGAATNVLTDRPLARAGWALGIDEVAVASFAVSAEDRVPAQPGLFTMDPLELRVRGLSNQSNAPVSVELTCRPNGTGRVAIEATGTLLPPAVRAGVKAEGLDVKPMQPYVSEYLHVLLNRGRATSTGTFHFALAPTNGPMIGMRAGFEVEGFSATDTVHGVELADWERVSLGDVQFDWQPNRLHVGTVRLAGLQAGVLLNSNGVLNVTTLLRRPPGGAGRSGDEAVKAPASGVAMGVPVTVGEVAFENCAFRAADHSVQPRFQAGVEEVGGAIRGLSLEAVEPAAVDIHGRFNPGSKFEVKGRVRPVLTNLLVDLAVLSRNADLTPFTPYLEKFGGYPLLKGRLSVDVAARLEGHRVHSSNVVNIDQLTLGARNTSTNAIRLPIKLGIALLKDRNGRIHLDVPVGGSLDDPKFSVGKVVWQVIENLLVKAATAPFALLGSMFGGGAELQYVDFDPGSAVVPTNQISKLATLVKALQERPALQLEIAGATDVAKDRAALTRARLDQQLRALRVAELAVGGPSPAAGEPVRVEAADYERLLLRAYTNAFGPVAVPAPPPTVLPAVSEAAVPAVPAIPAVAPITNSVAGARTNVSSGAVTSSSRSGAPAFRRTGDGAKGAARLGRGFANPLAPAPQATEPSVAIPPAGPAPSVATASTPPPEPAPVPPPAALDAQAEAVPALPPVPSREEMERKLLAKFEASDDDLRALARKRVEVVQRQLLDSGQIEAERLMISAGPASDAKEPGRARVTFTLN